MKSLKNSFVAGVRHLWVRRLPLKTLRRWPRILLGLLYLYGLYQLLTIIREEYIETDLSSATNNSTGAMAIGLSLVTQEPQTFLTNSNPTSNEVSRSFLIQSQNPTVQVFADYISIYENAELSKYCFESLRLKKDINIPAEVTYGLQKRPEEAQVESQSLGNLLIEDSYAVFKFTEPFCLQRGEKGNQYYLPHLFLGTISSETTANLPLPKLLHFSEITGHRALEFFPFEQQKMILNLDAYYILENKLYTIRPYLDVSISQQGWIGKLNAIDKENTALTLTRPFFYKAILIAFTIAMILLVLLLNNIIDEIGSFFEVGIGLLLGLWGTHEILIPEYIGASIPIDIVIYILYALVIGEIIVTMIDEALQIYAKRSIKIKSIKSTGLEDEHVLIENQGWFPIDLTRWVLIDQASNKFKFPVFVLPGRTSFSTRNNPTIKIWTKSQPKNMNPEQLGEHLRENLYWGRKKEVWDNDHDTAYLEDAEGDVINIFAYSEINEHEDEAASQTSQHFGDISSRSPIVTEEGRYEQGMRDTEDDDNHQSQRAVAEEVGQNKERELTAVNSDEVAMQAHTTSSEDGQGQPNVEPNSGIEQVQGNEAGDQPKDK